MKNAFVSLSYSRKFWLMILDLLVSLILFFVGKYATPMTAEDIFFIIGALQPVFVALIGGIAVEDAAMKYGLTQIPSRDEHNDQ